ncbi:MAG TPA: ChaN family lipoprotein [Polyangiaceae bacterium]|nr:ChaN family lipoprotein [Polyangiaceae bacterium]
MKNSWRFGLLASMCWGCGASSGDVDDLYDVPVAAPTPPDRVNAPSSSAEPGEAASPLPAAGDPAVAAPDDAASDAPSGGRAVGAVHGLTLEGELSEPELYDRLAGASAVCFGETHDDVLHHRAQARAARELAARARGDGVPFALGFEMFQTPFQSALTGFALGALDERELIVDSEYATRWGYDFGFYRPLLELVRELRLPALALNAPAELTRKIAAEGLDGLSPEERAALPELDLDDAEYRAYVSELLGTFHADEASLEGPYTVQVVWDETMADTAADWLASSDAGARVLVIAGLGHCHRSAIPERITRRTGLETLAVAPVRASRLGAEGFPTLEHYDVLVVIDD